VKTKVCKKCLIEKEICNFGKTKQNKDGLKSYCKECLRIDNKEYVKRNPEKRKETLLTYYENNKEKELERFKIYKIKNPEKRKETYKKYYENNKDLINKKQYQINKKKYNQDITYRIKHNLRERVKDYLKETKSVNHNTFTIVGCSPTQLKEHLENMFSDGMTWENYGFYGWHIDHIIPLSSAKDEDGLKKLCHYTNLQPLWCKDNLSKGSKIL
jgi:hypothetical protein